MNLFMEERKKFGDFEEVIEEKKPQKQTSSHSQQTQENIPVRVRMPGKNQLIGMVTQRLGGNRMSVLATDKKIRNCRVPGRFSRRFWIRPKDIVLIEPWQYDNEKADIVHHYKGNELNQLRKRGLLDNLKEDF